MDLKLFDADRSFWWKKDGSRAITMASGRFIFLLIADHNGMRLDRITPLPYRPLAGRYILLSVRMQVFGIFLVVPADSAIEQFLTSLFFVLSLVSMYFGIVEPLKAPVIAAFLLFIDWCCSVPWLKTAHDISIVDMRFFYRQLPPVLYRHHKWYWSLYPETTLSPHGTVSTARQSYMLLLQAPTEIYFSQR